MKRLHRYTLIAFICISVSSIVVLYSQSSLISNHHRNYILREGMWTMMETERTLLNLREIVRRISLGDVISPETYNHHRGAAFFRAGITSQYAKDNPNFSEKEMDLLLRIEEALAAYTNIDNQSVPNQTEATRLIPLLDLAISHAHTLLNTRRELTYASNRETFAHIDRLWTFLVVTVGALSAALLFITTITRRIAYKEKEQAVARYRYHMTNELHDAMNYHLAIVMQKLERASKHIEQRPELTRELIGEAKTRSKLALDDTRATLQVLRIGNIQPIETTIHKLASDNDRLPAIIHVTGCPYDLPDNVAFAVYRIVQEAFTNTFKHAPKATEVTITLTYQSSSFILHISDNGGDSHLSNSNNFGMGLVGMRDRVEQLGGTITYGLTGTGYEICVEIPTEEHNASHTRIDR